MENKREKGRVRLRPDDHMTHLRDALTDCRLEDIGFQGKILTWKKRCRVKTDFSLK